MPDNQPDLLEPVEGELRGAPGPLENSQPLNDRGVQGEPRAGGGRRGRPPGAVNKKTLTLQKYILALGYTHPAIILAEITARPVEELAAHLRCSRLDAFQEQRKAASDLMPYFEGRILPKTDEGDQPLPQLHIHLGDDQVALSGQKGGNAGPVVTLENMKEIHETVDGEKSHEVKALK